MDIKLTDSSIRKFLDTKASPQKLAEIVSLCGPTFDRVISTGNDYLYEIEIITNRIDSASAQGVAREASAILNQQGVTAHFKNDPYLVQNNLYSNLPQTFSFTVSDPQLVPRLTAVSLEKVTIGTSPTETQNFLSLCGQRPLNNLVDITNEVTLLYGMPCHVFDQDKLALQKLTIRLSQKGEMIETLDGKKNKLQGGDIVIEDGSGRLVDLCGVMGGAIAEVDNYTKNILLIVPAYQPSHIRKTSLYLQKRTLASQIYEKQPDPELCLPVLTQTISLITERTGARVSSKVFDFYPAPAKEKSVKLDLDWLENFIGTAIPQTQVVSILTSLGFQTSLSKGKTLVCTVPSWRNIDINLKEDVVEEIARVYGYSKLKPLLPAIFLSPEKKDPLIDLETKIKNYLSVQGFNEVYNSSLISENLIKKTNLDPQDHLKLTNALSSDNQYLRTSLVPSILQSLKNNQGKSPEPFLLFETSNVYLPGDKKTPDEVSNLVVASTLEYRQTKGVIESLFNWINVKNVTFSPSQTPPSYFSSENTAAIIADNTIVGYLGKLSPQVTREMTLTSEPIIAELNIVSLSNFVSPVWSFSPISEYPEIIESITLEADLPLAKIITLIGQTDPLINGIDYLESYGNKHTFRVHFISHQENLSQEKINLVKEKIRSNFS